MPISISKAQAAAISDGSLDVGGEDINSIEPVTLSITEKVLVQYLAEFKLKLSELINSRQVVGSGNLDSTIRTVVVDESTIQLWMNDYFDYPNKGVKGVKSSRNAPNSPYQYKNYGMSDAGRQSIKQYIQSGRAKIANVGRTKQTTVGLERKRLSLIDTQTNQLVYMIKKYGIKATAYFDDAFKEVFKDFEVKMAEALGADFVWQLNKLNKK